jgi:molybdopterin-guanine dinucleotide biosynthesis protein A
VDLSTLAVILSGGESARMGRDKHLLTLPDGRTFTHAVHDVLAPLVSDTLVVGHARGIEPRAGMRIVDDDTKGLGPLGGIATALAHANEATRLLVVTCDAPLIPRALLIDLLATDAPAVACADERGALLPLPCALDVTRAGAAMAHALSSGSRGVGAFLRALGVSTVAIDDDTRTLVTGVNTPEEFAALKARATA